MVEILRFDKEIILENDIVKLQPLTDDHLDELLVFARQEPTLWQYSLQPADGDHNMKLYLESAMEAKKKETSYPFLVFDKRTGTYAGSTRFYDYQVHNNTTQLGFTWYGQRFWGTGLNQNCKYLMLDFAFGTLGLDRVEFRADYNNARSIAAMKGIGCVEEGVLRSNCAAPAGRRDSIILSILREEWFGGIKEQLSKKCIPK